MWYQITNLWNKGKYWIIAGAVAVLYILGYRRGKEKEQVKVMKGTVDNVKTAKRSRDSLADPGLLGENFKDKASELITTAVENRNKTDEIVKAKQGEKIDFLKAIEKCKELVIGYRKNNKPNEKIATFSLWVSAESEKAIEIEEEFLNKLANAYNTYDCSELENYLADDVTYDSTWVLDQMKSKTHYLDYLHGKLNTMKRTGTKTNFVMMHKRNHGKPVLMLSPEIPEGGYGAFTAEANEEGLIKAVHITPAAFYAPLVCKDEEKYKQFIKIAEESKK